MMNFGSLNVGIKQVRGTWVPRVFDEKEMVHLQAQKQHARVMRATKDMMGASNPFAEFDKKHQRGNPFAGRLKTSEAREAKPARKMVIPIRAKPVVVHTDVTWPENGKVHSLSKKREPCKQPKKSRILAHDLITQVLNISKKAGKSVDIIGKRRCCLKPRRRNNKLCFGVVTKHQNGVISHRDMVRDPFIDSIIEHIAYMNGAPLLSASGIKPGDSGLIYREKLNGYATRVVRGRREGEIIDAREYVNANIHAIKHYSDDEKLLVKYAPYCQPSHHTFGHMCRAVWSDTEILQFREMLSQAIMPQRDPRCDICAEVAGQRTKDEILQHARTSQMMQMLEFGKEDERWKAPRRVMETLLEESNWPSMDYSTSSEITTICCGNNDEPFRRIYSIMKVLAEPNLADVSAWQEANSSLLQLARYMKNREMSVQAGNSATFTNPFPPTVHTYGPMHNGADIIQNPWDSWGDKQPIALAFFEKHFEKWMINEFNVDRRIRKHIRGTRTLALMDLTQSRSIKDLEDHVQEEEVPYERKTEACITMYKDQYLYSCSCVTARDGKPYLSMRYLQSTGLIPVTRGPDVQHMPNPDTWRKFYYVAPEGYCYINIFLPMLALSPHYKVGQLADLIGKLIKVLGKWPKLKDIALACLYITEYHTYVQNALLPPILVHHGTRTMHVVDALGSLSIGYHLLKASTVKHLTNLASRLTTGDMLEYNVGGSKLGIHAYELLIRGTFDQDILKETLELDPYYILYSALSPTVLKQMYTSKAFANALKVFVRSDQTLFQVVCTLENLARRMTRAQSIEQQIVQLQSIYPQLIDLLADNIPDSPLSWLSHYVTTDSMQRVIEMNNCDIELARGGYASINMSWRKKKEQFYADLIKEYYNALPRRARYLYRVRTLDICTPLHRYWRGVRKISFGTVSSICTQAYSHTIGRGITIASNGGRVGRDWLSARGDSFYKTMIARAIRLYTPEVNAMIGVATVIGLLLSVMTTLGSYINRNKQSQLKTTEKYEDLMYDKVALYIPKYDDENPDAKGKELDFEHFSKWLLTKDRKLSKFVKSHLIDTVAHQAKDDCNVWIEKCIATIVLMMMAIDSNKSDKLYQILCKLRTIFSTMGQTTVTHQSIDEILDIEDSKQTTVDFERVEVMQPTQPILQTTFEGFWDMQIQMGRTVPHYRTTGRLVELTRENVTDVVATVSSDTVNTEFIIRGGVGTGKSTSLPTALCERGRVLMLEPTRPLTENVAQQLRGEPHFKSPSVHMRGLNTFGSSRITIMTSGYALHYYANNRQLLRDFEFILFDECHVMDSSAMAFYSLCSDAKVTAKLLKVSATPAGRECEFRPIFPVRVAEAAQLSFESFVTAQGSKSTHDVTQYGNNILVYVASYNEVDKLSAMLLEKRFRVTKVDGRTMKLNTHGIELHGTPQIKHFVVATNIIENGVTLEIDCLVDFGTKVLAQLDTEGRRIMYTKVPISYGERIQRLGRVGRTKPGAALKIGHTMRGIVEIPEVIATEAAFQCFMYDLPVMTGQVSVSLLSKCTREQARTMAAFELSPFTMSNLVAFDGTMHPAIHDLVKKFKLRDSTIVLRRTALPLRASASWYTVREYESIIGDLHIENKDVRIPFIANDLSNSLLEGVWDAIQCNRSDVSTLKLTTVSANQIAYTLKTDASSIQRTISIIDDLLTEERRKQEMFTHHLSTSSSGYTFGLNAIAMCIKSRYAKGYCIENIATLTNVRNQLTEFSGLAEDQYTSEIIQNYPDLTLVQHQSKQDIIRSLKLKAKYDQTLIASDLLLGTAVLIGGGAMLYKTFMSAVSTQVCLEGDGKRQRQKLQFRAARDSKQDYEVYADDREIQENYGEAYTKHGRKGPAHEKGMGAKTREFTNFYGFDPAEYDTVRLVDPITGKTCDKAVRDLLRMRDVTETFADIREAMDEDGVLQPGVHFAPALIEAYFMNNRTNAARRVDLVPHNPMQVGRLSNNIAGFPLHDGELRQSRPSRPIQKDRVPLANEYSVQHESKSIAKGLRDYHPVSSNLCALEYYHGDMRTSIYGVCYGPYILTTAHLIKEKGGWLKIRTKHGLFKLEAMDRVQIRELNGSDIIVIKGPKDMPPAPMRLKFRAPKSGERAVLVGFVDDNLDRQLVSDSSAVYRRENTGFWKHWITTKYGNCGLPMVSVETMDVIGLHSLGAQNSNENYFAALTDDFAKQFLEPETDVPWQRKWSYNADRVNYGTMDLTSNQPSGSFRTTKLLADLLETVTHQSREYTWLTKYCGANLMVIGTCPGNLITKHVIKGKSSTFSLFLSVDTQAKEFFQPLLEHYEPSRLNREAFVKDITKYDTEIPIGNLNIEAFENAVEDTYYILKDSGIEQCNYITDAIPIFDSMNMKAATGALYGGKKKDYFLDYTDDMKQDILKESYLRLREGKMGIWNGSLKAELRPKEKVAANKTRVFTAAPLDTLLAGKGCVDDFNNQFYAAHLKGPWTVGITKFFGRWNDFLTELPTGWEYFDADGSRFDSSLTPFLLNAVLNIRKKFMIEWKFGQRCLENLYTEIIYTPIATPDGSVIKKMRGNNSGQPSTVVDNTIMVIIAMQYAINKAGFSGGKLRDQIRYFANGDDLVIAVEPSLSRKIETFGQSFAELGLNYDFTNKVTNRSELQFMSHTGKLIEGMYIPMLDRERVCAILEWSRSDEPQFQLDAISAAMIEAWGDDELLYHIRRYYSWLLEQEPYKSIAELGHAPYLAEPALKALYTGHDPDAELIAIYEKAMMNTPPTEDRPTKVVHEASTSRTSTAASQSSTSTPAATTTTTPGSTTTAPAATTTAAPATTTTTAPATTTTTPVTTATASTPSTTTATTTPAVRAANIRTSQDTERQRRMRESQLNVRGENDDEDVPAASEFALPRLPTLGAKIRVPKFKGAIVLNKDHLIKYTPDQRDLSNTRATQEQFEKWYTGVKNEIEKTDEEMALLMNGFMVWCMENGTSPDLSGSWTMMEGEEQLSYPLEPFCRHAQPTLRSIMAHFSDAATAYVVLRNQKSRYMPRYGLKRGLNDYSLAPYAFDFYEITSTSPLRAREAHTQMKAAAIRGKASRMFGLDGNVSAQSENTERHTVEDVNTRVHSLSGANML
uniref:Genome polyprotein n=1 Tax=Ryegrass mosaic virus TaxID=40666 RepID=A0A6M3RDA2_9POTY|nr:polyprotein [Ryegrass mosaic virus]